MGLKDFTPEELAGLTPDELEAVTADADDGDEEVNGEEAAPDTTEAAPTAEATESADDASSEDEPFNIAVPENAAEKRAELTAERDKAFAELMDGTIDTAQYSEINNRVSAQLEDLASTIANAKLIAAQTEHAIKMEWKRTVTAHMEAAKAEGLDYKSKPELHSEFDGLVKVFAAEASAKGMTDVGLKASKYALEQAQLVMRARHGVANTPANAPKGQSAAEKAIADANAVRHNLKTLSTMPAADRVMTDESPLAKIATLEGEDLEVYMASLSPAEVRRLEAAANA